MSDPGHKFRAEAIASDEVREVPIFGYSVWVRTAILGDEPATVLDVAHWDGTTFRLTMSNAETFALAHELMRGVRPQ